MVSKKTDNQKIIQKGAEAILYLNEEKQLVKERIPKSYRIKVLDEKIRKLRTRNESKIIALLENKICVIKIIQTNEKNKKIIMEFIEGKKLSEYLDKFKIKDQKKICRQVGKNTGEIHQLHIIHGDLTTSNMILKPESNNKKIYFIDFGLAYRSHKWEDRAVDLHLLRRALEAKHFKNWRENFHEVLKGYKESYKDKKDVETVMKRLEKVEKRGRYKH